MTLYFGELPVGTAFEFFGKRYRKEGLALASGDHNWGYVFQNETVVTVAQEPKERLPWKPNLIRWSSWLGPAPSPKFGK
jgi:hypothetical protein